MPLPPRVGDDEVLRSFAFELNQDEVWNDNAGQQHLLDDMSVKYKRAVLGFLERRSEEIATKAALSNLSSTWLSEDFGWDYNSPEEFLTATQSGAVIEAFQDRDLADWSPIEWLNRQPLVIRLRHDVANNLGGDD